MKTTGQTNKIKKDNFTKLNELLGSLQIIKDSLDLYEKSKDYQILPISGQLRALLLDKNSLLFELAELTSISTDVWYLPYDKNAYVSGAVFSFHRLMVSLNKSYPKHTKISLQELLKKEIIEIDGLTAKKDKDGNPLPISSELLIKSYAEKAGGAHYDLDIEEYIVHSLQQVGKHNVNSFIIDIAKIVIQLGLNIIRKIGCFDFQIALAINPKQNINERGCIFEAVMPNSPMLYMLFIDNMFKLHFLFADINNRGTAVASEQKIDWTIPHIINITAEITSELKTEVVLYVDGKCFGKTIENSPILVLSEPTVYEEIFNMSKLVPYEPIEFGIGDFLLYGRVLDIIERANNITIDLQRIDKTGHGPCAVFKKDINAKKDVGTRDLKFNKIPTWSWSLSKIANGKMPE